MCVFVFYTISILAYVKIKALVHYVYAAESLKSQTKEGWCALKKANTYL